MFFTTPVEDGLCFSQSAQFIRHRKFHKHKFHNNLTALTYVFLDTFCESEKRVKINTPALIMRMRTYAVNEKHVIVLNYLLAVLNYITRVSSFTVISLTILIF